MMNISIHLYGKPSWDMDIEGNEDINPKMLRDQGDYLKEHLYAVAAIVEKLQAAGWDCSGTLYSLELYKDLSVKGAKKELKELGINMDDVHLEELEEE